METRFVKIESERFILKELCPDDASETYLGWLQGGEVRKFITYAEVDRSIQDLRRYIADNAKNKDVLFLGVFVRDSLVHIGNIKFDPVDRVNRLATLGILIGDPKWRGKGVAPEIIRICALWLNKHRGIERLTLGVHADNTKAIKAYQKVGFEIEETTYTKASDNKHLTMTLEIV